MRIDINPNKISEENNRDNSNVDIYQLQNTTLENISKIEIKEFLNLLEKAKKEDSFFCSYDIKDIENFLYLYKNLENTSFVLYDIKVDSSEDDIKDEVKAKLPFMLKRYVFDHEWFTWVRYYVFKKKDYLKIAVWFYWWSGWRRNDWDFRDFFHKNWETKKLELSKIMNLFIYK